MITPVTDTRPVGHIHYPETTKPGFVYRYGTKEAGYGLPYTNITYTEDTNVI